MGLRPSVLSKGDDEAVSQPTTGVGAGSRGGVKDKKVRSHEARNTLHGKVTGALGKVSRGYGNRSPSSGTPKAASALDRRNGAGGRVKGGGTGGGGGKHKRKKNGKKNGKVFVSMGRRPPDEFEDDEMREISSAPTSPSLHHRERLLQVGRLSPVDPRTNKAKIPLMKKSASAGNFLADDHKYTGHVDGGIRSLNMELWYAACTRAGNEASKQRKKNQDTYFMEDCLGGNPHLTMFGVFDGHGETGHTCSHFVRDCVLEHIGDKNKVLSDGNQEKIVSFIESALRKSASRLKNNIKIDTAYSGCTGTLCLINSKERKLYCFNVGDSKIILGRGKQRVADVVELTFDHSPFLPGETERIERCGGRVLEANGIGRVYLKDEKSPGLAMTRSFGDDVASTVGVTSDPDHVVRSFAGEDRFIILGSDGIFDFLSYNFISSVVSEMMRKGRDPQVISERLVYDAVKKWKTGKNEYVDDVTAVVVYLNAHPGKGEIKL